MNKRFEMAKPPGMSWRTFMDQALGEDEAWGHSLHSDAVLWQLFQATSQRLAKARLDASGPRLVLPRVLVVASSKVPAKARATGFSRTRSSAEVQQAIARRLALR